MLEILLLWSKINKFSSLGCYKYYYWECTYIGSADLLYPDSDSDLTFQNVRIRGELCFSPTDFSLLNFILFPIVKTLVDVICEYFGVDKIVETI